MPFSKVNIPVSPGVVCPLVGRVSMDAIKLPEEAKDCREFQAITDSFNDITSVTVISRLTYTLVCLCFTRSCVPSSMSCVHGRYHH